MVAWFIFLQHKYYAFVAWKKGSVVFMSIQLVIVVVYIALLFGISLWVKHKADSGSTAFLLAGRKLNTILVAVNVTGLAVGAASTVGVAQRASVLVWQQAGITVPGLSVLLLWAFWQQASCVP
mgnify:FL=1